ncbi:MAG: TonB-dependent receptor family protein [Prevotellaceae bacterium]|jgi:hypothetical protein|nr:TonB-dependent receptor family protein [Prevotellaceae bacterium]
MKKIRFIVAVCIVQFVVNAVFAQNISIKGKLIDEDSIPVVSANIVLQNENNEKVAAMETNHAGDFSMQNILSGINYKLTISYLGYETQEFDFEKPTKNIDLNTITLFKTTTELEGAVVKSVKAKITDDRRIVYPTQRQLEITADGITLLNAMKLPNLTVIPGSTDVRYWGRGDFKFYINDNEATVKQISALSPKDIVSVEYIDRPGIEYGMTEGLVIKYITKKIERGVTNSLSIDKYLNRNSGEADMESRINYKNSEFAVNYDAGYGKSRHFNVTKTDETFNLTDGVLHRNEIATGYDGEVATNVKHDIALAYIYSRPQKERFYIKAEYASYNSPTNTETSVLYNSGLRNDTTNKYNAVSNNDKTYTAAIYYRKYFGEKQFITLMSNYYNSQLNKLSNYRELNGASAVINDITANVDGKSQGFYAQALYSLQFSDKISFTTALLNQYTNAKNTYTGDVSSFSNVKRNLTTFYNQLSGSFGKFYVDLYLILLRNRTDISDSYGYVRFEFNPDISGRYVFNDRNYIGFGFSFYTVRPRIADLSTATQIIDEIQVRRGNPKLKSGYGLGPDLNGNIGLWKFDINWYAYYEFNKNSIWEETYLENNTVVRMPHNMNNLHALKTGLEISPDLFDWLSMSVAFGYNRYDNQGNNYNHTYNNLWMRLNTSVSWKRWTFSTDMWTHNNDFYGEILGTSGRSISLTLLRTWFDGKLSTAIEISEPFSKNYSKQGIINYSKIAPYENWMYYNYDFRMLTFRISYKFNFGRKSSDTNIQTGVNAEKGIINSDKSAEQK